VSVGDGGETLRLHEAFRAAPPEVLRAIGRMYARGARAAERERGREAVRRFLRENPPEPPAPRRRRVPPGDRAHLERLQAEFDRVNEAHFGGALPRVPLYLSG